MKISLWPNEHDFPLSSLNCLNPALAPLNFLLVAPGYSDKRRTAIFIFALFDSFLGFETVSFYYFIASNWLVNNTINQSFVFSN